MKQLLLVLAVALPLAAQDSNFVKLAEVWKTVKFEHPAMLRGDVDWDAALVRAVPKAQAAKNDAELAKAIGEMLAELNDPATRVVERPAEKPELPAARSERNVLVVNRFDPSIAKDFEVASAVVLDVRSGGITTNALVRIPGIVRENVPDVPMRSVFHSGYAPQQGTTSGGYYSGFLTTFTGGINARPNAPGVAKRLVFVTDGGENLPLAAIALWWNGNAAIVSEKPLGALAEAGTTEIEIGKSHIAHVRTSELAARGLEADVIAADALAKGIELAASSTPFAMRPPLVTSEVAAKRVVDKTYPDMHYPDLGHRMLALARLWAVIDTFYPYMHLIGDWDAVLAEFVPRFQSAKDEQEYAAAVLEMVARVDDGHSSAYGHRAANEILGAWNFPAIVREVEGQFVVAEKRANFPEGTPLAIGDVIVSVDGEPLAPRVQRLWKYRTASTESARRNAVLSVALRGPANSVAKLGVRNADGTIRTVDVPRVEAFARGKREGEVYRILDGNIGYADLSRLMPADVDAMFEKLMNTKAIVFDMRGYPNGTAWPIAPRINRNKAKYGATFRRVMLPRYSENSGFAFSQPLPTSDKPVYQGKTVMLIDDRAISQSEHTGLFFEAAAGTKFVGTNSAGANGDVTSFTLPGGFTVGFTGHDVRHADGRQLQRIGLVPDVRVEPTIRGLREGKDEVLERAIAYINDGK
ncbi:MAG TPA: S41 family peptidase [Thermoanaerobaculia bacterium]|nr:S41 family peptidase [Thermoanaerobaculia bacterium]